MKQQVEDRLKYFESGVMPKTNAEAMAAAVKEVSLFVLGLFHCKMELCFVFLIYRRIE